MNYMLKSLAGLMMMSVLGCAPTTTIVTACAGVRDIIPSTEDIAAISADLALQIVEHHWWFQTHCRQA